MVLIIHFLPDNRVSLFLGVDRVVDRVVDSGVDCTVSLCRLQGR